ncbi:MAG: phosphodiester glycosidase family protein [Candidatus Sericytochromatia bacterium]|nr:phosphodiester glycosidase family protein [Candidatus Tanganyikabacteria bacterium]
MFASPSAQAASTRKPAGPRRGALPKAGRPADILREGLRPEVDSSAEKRTILRPGGTRKGVPPVDHWVPASSADQAARALAGKLETVSPGLRYASTRYGGRDLHAVVLGAGARAELWAGDPANETGTSRRTQTVEAAARGALMAVNGSFSTPSDGAVSQPLGPVIAGGEVRVNTATYKTGWGPVPRSFLGWDRSGVAFVGETRPGETGAQLLARLKAEGRDPREVLGGLGSLLVAGQPADRHAREVQGLNSGQASTTPNARTVAGVTADGRVVLLVQEGDAAAGTGAGVDALGQVLLALRLHSPDLDIREAVILDGGGTSELAIPGSGVDSREGLYKRRIPTILRILPAQASQ